MENKKIGTEKEILIPLKARLLKITALDLLGGKSNYPGYIKYNSFREMRRKIKFLSRGNKKILVLYNFEIALYLLKEDPKIMNRISFFTSDRSIYEFMRNNGFNSVLGEEGKSINASFSYNDFDFILGNPPYTKGKNKSFYTSFIKDSIPLLRRGGTLCLVTPHVWIDKNSNLFRSMALDGFFSCIERRDPNQVFYERVELGTPVSWFCYQKGSDVRGVSEEAKESTSTQKSDIDRLVDKLIGKGIKPIGGQKGELRDYSPTAQGDFVYPVFLGSGDERSLVYSNMCPKGFGTEKLIVSSILEPNRAERFSEISTNKGVGRYSKYFPLTGDKPKNARSFYNTQTYVFINSIKRNGRYADLTLPDLDYSKSWTDQEIWDLRKLSLEEIEIIKSAVPTSKNLRYP